MLKPTKAAAMMKTFLAVMMMCLKKWEVKMWMKKKTTTMRINKSTNDTSKAYMIAYLHILLVNGLIVVYP